MKARILALLIILFGLSGQARADVLYCLEQSSGVLHTTIIAHSKFMDGVRPKELEAWPCQTVYLLFSTTKLGPDTDLNDPDTQMLVRVAKAYWTPGNSLNAIRDELRKKSSGRPRVGTYDPLYLKAAFTRFRPTIMSESTTEAKLAKFVALASNIRSTVTIESDGDPNSLSYAGAMGLIQIMKSTETDASLDIKQLITEYGEKNLFDPMTNLLYGADEIWRKLNAITPLVKQGYADWTVTLKGTDGKPLLVNGKKVRQKRHIDGLTRDQLWFYVMTAYNRGFTGWQNWERHNRQTKQNGLVSDYALKWARYARTYCPGIDLVKMTCPTTPEWFRKALASDMNSDIAKQFPTE